MGPLFSAWVGAGDRMTLRIHRFLPMMENYGFPNGSTYLYHLLYFPFSSFLYFYWPSLHSFSYFLSLFHLYPFMQKVFLCTYCVPGTVPRDPADVLCLRCRVKIFSLFPPTPLKMSRLESAAWAPPLKGQACESNIQRLEFQLHYLSVAFILSNICSFLTSILSSVK